MIGFRVKKTAFPPDPMRIKCVSPWGGGKRTLAPKIVELLGEHTEYHEPFVGGCAILARKPRCAVERINDLNPKVVRVLKSVRDDYDKLGGALARVPFAEGTYLAAVDWLKSNPDRHDWLAVVQQLIVWWMGPNGLAGTTAEGWFATRHSTTGGSPAVRWESFKGSLQAHSERLAGVEVRGQHFKDYLLTVPDCTGAALYVDPPYLDKAFKYECDFALEDHYLLSMILNRSYSKSRVVVSYYDHPLLAELYPAKRWRRVEVNVSKAIASTSGTAKRAVEVLLVNDVGGRK